MTDDNALPCPLCRNLCRNFTPLHGHLEPGPNGGRFIPRNVDGGFLYNCETCGSFVITLSDQEVFLGKETRNETDVQRLSALLRERNIQKMTTAWIRLLGDEKYAELVGGELGEPVNCVHIQTCELLARWPHTVPEKLDRTLRNLAWLSPKGGVRLQLHRDACGVCFASDPDEQRYHVESLAELGLLQDTDHSLDGVSWTVVSAKGWARFDELTSGGSSRKNPAFVAMWFGLGDGDEDRTAEMSELYRKSMSPAAEDAGYRVARVDGQEYNDFVMDKVLGSIRLAPFVIADFTGYRGGVYFEAGFARGLGIEVIHTCNKEHFRKAHFDIKQVNTITWEKPGDLRERLYHRIRGTLGEGPYKKRET